jgi:hypothetical protein
VAVAVEATAHVVLDERFRVVESTVFYTWRTVDVLVRPTGAILSVQLRRRNDLNVRTLATLA